MKFAQVWVEKPDDDGEMHLKMLARDIMASFRRMRLDERLQTFQLRAIRSDAEIGQSIADAITKIELAARHYYEDNIPLEVASRHFQITIPTMIRCLLSEMQNRDDDMRVLSPDVDVAMHQYYDSPSMENAKHFVAACVLDQRADTHWLFDNLARVVAFCDEVMHRSQGLG